MGGSEWKWNNLVTGIRLYKLWRCQVQEAGRSVRRLLPIIQARDGGGYGYVLMNNTHSESRLLKFNFLKQGRIWWAMGWDRRDLGLSPSFRSHLLHPQSGKRT